MKKFLPIVLLLAGCHSVKPLKPGSASLRPASLTLTQPENPEAPSTQQQDVDIETRTVFPPAENVSDQVPVAAGASLPRSVAPGVAAASSDTRAVTPQPVEVYRHEIRHASQQLGGAQKDTTRSLSARLAAWRPVQYFGIVLIVAGVALAYFGWWTKAGICWTCGAAMLLIAAVVPGHELLILAVGGAVAAFALLLALAAYYQGHHAGTTAATATPATATPVKNSLVTQPTTKSQIVPETTL